MSTKVERVERLLRYLIYIGELPINDLQKAISEKTGANKVSVSRALSGNDEYLTNSFIERLNSNFGDHFELDWLLRHEGKMIRENQVSIGDVVNNRGTIVGKNDGKIKQNFNKETSNGLKNETTNGDKHQVNNFYNLPKDEIIAMMHKNAHDYAVGTSEQIEICKQMGDMLNKQIEESSKKDEVLNNLIEQNKSLIEQIKSLTERNNKLMDVFMDGKNK